MTRTLVIATRNAHKLEEIGAVLHGCGFDLRSAADFPGCPEVLEDGSTLEANAEKKARQVAGFTGCLALADDTGLEVEALGGAPGVLSARYAGEGASFADNCAKLLREMAGVPDSRRAAVFRCALALADPGGEPKGLLERYEGRLVGRIGRAPRGAAGFGYDPIFYLPQFDCTLAELSFERKNAVSHRGRALVALRAGLTRRLGR